MNNEFLSDPWLTLRFRKYTANPKRWAWKNKRETKNQFQFTFLVNGLIGSVLTAPLAVWVGRRAQYGQGGVPTVPMQRWVHDFPNVDPGFHPRRTFRWWFLGTCMFGGILFAYATTSTN